MTRLSRRCLVRRGAALVLLLGAREIAWGATIVAVRVWPADEVTRVTLESDAELAARHQVIANPPRLVANASATSCPRAASLAAIVAIACRPALPCRGLADFFNASITCATAASSPATSSTGLAPAARHFRPS